MVNEHQDVDEPGRIDWKNVVIPAVLQILEGEHPLTKRALYYRAVMKKLIPMGRITSRRERGTSPPSRSEETQTRAASAPSSRVNTTTTRRA